MRNASQVSAALSLLVLILVSGCSDLPLQKSDLSSRYPDNNMSYSQYGLFLPSPNNFFTVERGVPGEKNVTGDQGMISLTGTKNNIAIDWKKTQRVPSSTARVYEWFWTPFRMDSEIPSVKTYTLQTSPSAMCGDMTFIGRAGFSDSMGRIPTNESFIIWLHAPGGQLYTIDIASAEDYPSIIRGNLSFLVSIQLAEYSVPSSRNSYSHSNYSSDNVNYSRYGFSFAYPKNLIAVERGILGRKNAIRDYGEIQLTGTEDNITIDWKKTERVPPNIPLLYESLRSSMKMDREISHVQIYNLKTYPFTTCGDATFIGHMSFYDNVRSVPTNEGLIMWYNASQDRLYTIDIASAEDYYSFIQGNLERYRVSFDCSAS